MKIKEIILSILFLLFYVGSYSQSAKLCTAKFGYNINQEVSPLTYQFRDSSISQNTIVKWEWDFGNGEKSKMQNPEHQYLATGRYVVSLTITDEYGCGDITEDTIVVSNSVPPSCNAYFTYALDTLASDYTYKFFDHSVHTNDSIVSWDWDFGDNTSIIHLPNPIHQYSSVGTYLVSLSISTANGCNSSYFVFLIINTSGINCVANFTSIPDSSSPTPYTILFHDNSLHLDPILNWKWYFSDGDSSSYQDPTHVFPYAGVYNVKLKITTASCSDMVEIPIQVGNPQKYNLWGRVYVGNLTADKCIAYLYRDFLNNHIIPIDTVQLTSVNDSLGVYYFYQIPEGALKVQIVLPSNSIYSTTYAPTYYQGSAFWQNSQNISLFQDLSMQNINMQALNVQIGTNYISGTINNQANAQKVLVFLQNSQNDIINYTFTDSIGNYSFSQVPQGQFYVYGDIAGYSSSPAFANFTTNNDSLIGLDFIISGNMLTAYSNLKNNPNKTTYDIYPNPVSGDNLFFTIKGAHSSQFSYQIYNTIGSLVKKGFVENKESINLKELKSGVYILSVVDRKGNNMGVKKIIIR